MNFDKLQIVLIELLLIKDLMNTFFATQNNLTMNFWSN